MISFARALGDARTGTSPAPRRKSAICNRSRQAHEAKDTYWANQVEVQRLEAAGLLAHAQGDDKKAVELVRQAADLEATMDKHPATPAPVLPARELLADLLLEAQPAGRALTEYEESLQHRPQPLPQHPGQGSRRQAAGDAAAAHDAYQKLVALSKPTGPERPELAEAKTYLTN